MIPVHADLATLLQMMPGAESIQESAAKTFYAVKDHEAIMCSISGGYDSDIVLDLLVRCGAKEKTTFVWYNTGLEYGATKDHIAYIEQKYGIEVQKISPKKSIPTCCRDYGVPFWSKYASDMIARLQRNGFDWTDAPLDELLNRFPKCRSALRWWCDDWGDGSRFNIGYTPYLKDYLIANPPEFRISAMCCEKSKKEPAHDMERTGGYDLIVTGLRKYEGGKRATTYKSCISENSTGADSFRPIFWWTDADKDLYRSHFGLVRSDCYELWGLKRTGCAGCPFAKNFESELNAVQKFEPKRYMAMLAVFGKSYDYTRSYLAFRAERTKRSEAKP